MSRIPQSEIDRIRKLDLAALISRDYAPAKAQRGGHVYFVCPFHDDHSPSLDVVTSKNVAFCNVCPKRLDPITWTMEYHRVSFVEACNRLGAERELPAVRIDATKPQAADYCPPPPQWQLAAQRVVAYCRQELWGDNGMRARAWLANRGISNETLSRWHIGYNPRSMDIGGLWVWAGIIIPCYQAGQLWGVKIRLLPNHPARCVACGGHLPGAGECPNCKKPNKYRAIKGSQPGLYGIDTVRHRRVVFACEGEFDALIVWQEARELGGVMTTTNGAGKDWRDQWTAELIDAERIITLYDNDTAGANGAAKLNQLPLGQRVHVATVPEGKDVTDYFCSDHSIYKWLNAVRTSALDSLFASRAAQQQFIDQRLTEELHPLLRADYVME